MINLASNNNIFRCKPLLTYMINLASNNHLFRLTQELNDKCDEIDEARLNLEDLDIVNKRLLVKLNSLPAKVKVRKMLRGLLIFFLNFIW